MQTDDTHGVKEYERYRTALKAIAGLGDNLSDHRLTATGSNDAVQRGALYVEARRIAKEAIGQPSGEKPMIRKIPKSEGDLLRSSYQPSDDREALLVLAEFLKIYAKRDNWQESAGEPPHYLRQGLRLDFRPSNVVDGWRFAEEGLEAMERYLQRVSQSA